jgi:hypothetical protein
MFSAMQIETRHGLSSRTFSVARRVRLAGAALAMSGCAAVQPPPVSTVCPAANSRPRFPITFEQSVSSPHLHASSFVLFVDGKAASSLPPVLTAGTHELRFEIVYWSSKALKGVVFRRDGSITLTKNAALSLVVRITERPDELDLRNRIVIALLTRTKLPWDSLDDPKGVQFVEPIERPRVSERMRYTRGLYAGCAVPVVCLTRDGALQSLTFLAYSHPDFDASILDVSRNWHWVFGSSKKPGRFCYRVNLYFGIIY